MPGSKPAESQYETATDLAEAIRSERTTSLEVVETHLARIEKLNPELNAIVTIAEESALKRAKEADAAIAGGESWGPLHGVPVTVKDAFETRGIRTTSGFEPLRDHVPDTDATVVGRLREAGAIILGKTNMSMLATDYQTDSPVFGRTNNPWDTERTPGGSSGGSAAAIAAGLSPLDIGSDVGGSVRVPAHFCGIYSLKPTEHRVPATGHIPDWYVPGVGDPPVVRHMGTYGPLARSLRDLELALTVVEGPDGRDENVRDIPADDGGDISLGDLQVAWCSQFGDLAASDEVAGELRGLSRRLEREGCTVTAIEPPIDFETGRRLWGEIVAYELATGLSLKLRALFWLLFMTSGRAPDHRGIARGIWMRSRRYRSRLSSRRDITEQVDRLFDEFDALLCPVATTTAFTHRKTGSRIEVDGRMVPYMGGAGGFTSLFNLSGHPVVTMPIGVSENELPIGVQIVGGRWQDRKLLGTATALEAVVDGFQPPSTG